jgi:multiple sugar transport system permease protein
MLFRRSAVRDRLTRAAGRSFSLRRREAIAGYLFALPWLLNLVLFNAYPIGAAIFYSFTDYDILHPPLWKGLENYAHMFTEDQRFWVTLYNSAYYAFLSVPLGLIVALGLALLLNMPLRGISFFRTAFYLPSVVPTVAASVLWLWLLNPEFGLINTVLGFLGLPGPPWLASETWSKPSYVLMSLWGIGPATIIFLAGLQDIPTHLYEAAALDGASTLQRHRHITLPMLTPTIFFNLVVGVINALQIFTQVYVMTRGGPLDSTLFYVLYLYIQGFQFFHMGYASALAILLFLVILLLTLLLMLSSRRWVYYEAQEPDR